MKASKIALFALLILASQFTHANEKGNGGKSIIVGDRLHLLDLVEGGVESMDAERIISTIFSNNLKWDDSKQHQLFNGKSKYIDPDFLFNAYLDTPKRLVRKTVINNISDGVFSEITGSVLKWNLLDSIADIFQNEYLIYGDNDPLGGNIRYLTSYQPHNKFDAESGNVYTQSADLSVALTNLLSVVFVNFENRPGYKREHYIIPALHSIVEAYQKLKWVVVNAPLRMSQDENSKFADEVKFMVASRTGITVQIARNGWDDEIVIGGKTIQPLNQTNKLALILHEILYFITEQQGYQTSDHAREINVLIFKALKVLEKNEFSDYPWQINKFLKASPVKEIFHGNPYPAFKKQNF